MQTLDENYIAGAYQLQLQSANMYVDQGLALKGNFCTNSIHLSSPDNHFLTLKVAIPY